MSTGEMSRLLTWLLIIFSQHMLVSANVCDASSNQCNKQGVSFASESDARAYKNNNPECRYVCNAQCVAHTSQGCSSWRYVCKPPNDYKPKTRTTCPDRTISNHYMNFNKLSKDFFCSWMHQKPYNIPLEFATSNSQSLISNHFANNLCTLNNNGDNCKDLLMHSNANACSISSGNILIVPKPKISIEQTLFASWDSIVPVNFVISEFIETGKSGQSSLPKSISFFDASLGFSNLEPICTVPPKACPDSYDLKACCTTTRMKEWHAAGRAACMNGGGHPVLCFDDAKYATRSPTCNTCQNEQPDCIESRFPYFEPKEDTKCAVKLQDGQQVDCYTPGVPGLTGWNEDATIAYCKDHAEANPYIWTSKPGEVDSDEYQDKLVPSTYVMIAGMTRGCFQNRNAISGSICAFVNAGCLVRLNNRNHPDFGKWMGMQNRQIYEIPGFTQAQQAQEFKDADDSTYTIIIPGGGVQITAWSNPYCQHDTVKTWKFTQDNDEQEIQFDRTYGETSTKYHSIEFTFLDDDTTDDEQKACLGPVAACKSGWGVSDPTTLTLEVTCQKCQPGEYSDPVKREDLFPSYTPCDNDIDIIYPICKACEANYIANEQKTGCVPCMAVNDRRPYRPVESATCTSCLLDTYWSVPDSDCMPIPIMELTCHDNPATGIVLIKPENDNFRRNPTINQLDYEPVPNGYFLNIQNRTIHRCDSVCSTYKYNHACGHPYLSGLYNMYLLPTINADINISSVSSVSDIPSCDGLDAYTLDRRGRCLPCTSCTSTQYNDGCGEVVQGVTQPGTCTTCVSYDDCSVNEYPYHIRPEGCAHEQAQTNAECRTCPVIEEDNNQYYIVLGCGKATTFERWRNFESPTNQIKAADPSDTEAPDVLNPITCQYSSSTTILDSQCAFKVGTLTQNIRNKLLKNEWRRIKYCPRGWYISQTPQLDEWHPNLCQKCADYSTGSTKKRSETYKACDGSGTSDTQTWVDSCEHNYYEYLGSCKNCETCSAGMITKVQLGD